tara:strand:- start:353 stop:1216 length:864 start_codon:yes stop_codon:yes gene_type:complete
MLFRRKKYILLFLTLLLPITANAHQPVMDMAPRWDDGYGFQVRHENYGSSKLISKDSKIDNSSNQKFSTNKTWFEGVYTFDKSIRATFKLPYIQKTSSTNGIKKSEEGLGDLILGLPLKYYLNKGAFTSNLSFTPSLRLPTGRSSGDLPISDNSTDLGLSLSYSTETPKFYQLYDLFYWVNNRGDRGINEGNELGLDINLGYHPIHDNTTNTGMFIMWDITARNHEKGINLNGDITGSRRVHTGPVLVLYKDNMMFRAEYKFPIYEYFRTTGLSRGNELNVGIGITF